MFGMSSNEFWEADPQLYFSYRTFYLKKLENETQQLNYKSWLNGSYSYLAVATALNNAFSKKKAKYPEKPFESKESIEKSKTKLQEMMEKEKDKNVRQQIEFNYWARL